MTPPTTTIQEAEQFVELHLSQLAGDLIDWQSGNLILQYSKLDTLLEMLQPLTSQSLALAEVLIKNAALRRVAQ